MNHGTCSPAQSRLKMPTATSMSRLAEHAAEYLQRSTIVTVQGIGQNEAALEERPILREQLAEVAQSCRLRQMPRGKSLAFQSNAVRHVVMVTQPLHDLRLPMRLVLMSTVLVSACIGTNMAARTLV